MNKISNRGVAFGICLFSLFFYTSCKDDFNDPDYSKINSSLSETNRLVFQSSEELTSLINKTTEDQDFIDLSKIETFALKDRNTSFTGLMHKISPNTALRSGNGESLIGEDYYTALGYDTLVPNKAFASLLNPEGEVQIKNTVYRITANGTYYYPSSQEELFDSLYSTHKDDLKGILVGENLYKITNSIFRFDTFKKDESFVDYPDEYYTVDESDAPASISLRSSIPEPDYDSFETFTADHHTIVGKFFENIIGNNRDFHVKISDKRRAGGSFYYYNYVVYKEIGVNVHADKKNWIGWSKTNADELRIGWQNVRVRFDLPVEASALYKTNQIVVTNPRIINAPDPVGCVDIFGLTEVDQKKFYSYVGKGVKSAWSFLKSKVGGLENKETANVGVFAVYTGSKVVVCYPPEFVKKINEDSYTHVFTKQFKFYITINPTDLPSSLLDYAKLAGQTVKDTQNMSGATLVGGEVISCARFGNTWGGMKIIKNNE